jgi:hypothetical protein
MGWRPTVRYVAVVAGFLFAWITLQYFGQHLAAMPDASHQRVLWREDPLDAP